MEEKSKKYKIDNWSVHELQAEKFTIPIIIGDVNGKEIRTDTIFWLDIEERVAMTKKDVYELGTPNMGWHGNITAAGYKLKDFEIKGTVH